MVNFHNIYTTVDYENHEAANSLKSAKKGGGDILC